MIVSVEYIGDSLTYRVAGEMFRRGETKMKDSIADRVFLQSVKYEKDIRVTELAPKEEPPKQETKVEVVEVEPLDPPKKKGRR